jgi:hypothetical protein
MMMAPFRSVDVQHHRGVSTLKDQKVPFVVKLASSVLIAIPKESYAMSYPLRSGLI